LKKERLLNYEVYDCKKIISKESGGTEFSNKKYKNRITKMQILLVSCKHVLALSNKLKTKRQNKNKWNNCDHL